MAAHGVEQDIKSLIEFIKKLGTESNGSYTVTFGVLFQSDDVAQTLEVFFLSVYGKVGKSLAGTLKAAKKRGILKYGPEMLLQGVSDKEIITLV